MKTFASRTPATKVLTPAPGKGPTLVDNRPAAVAQRKMQETIANSPRQAAPRPNRTGLPDKLKAGVESLSGYSLDDVQVHYNSAKPAQLQAHAYAQGTDIHLAPGQEEHLPHEAWHVVQQKQGRVRPTMQLKGKVGVNDDAALEREADVMGGRATATNGLLAGKKITNRPSAPQTVQRIIKLNDGLIMPKDYDRFIEVVHNLISSSTLTWLPSHAALLTNWLQSRVSIISINDIEHLAYNLYYHADDESKWISMSRSQIAKSSLSKGEKRRMSQRTADLLVPSKVQIVKSVEGMSKLKDEQLLRLAPRNQPEREVWIKGASGRPYVAKRRNLVEEDEARIVAAGNKDDPSYVVFKGGKHVGHRYKGADKPVNHSKKRTYGSKKRREGYEYKGSGLVDGHAIQAQDDQRILGPMRHEAPHWSTTVKTTSGSGPTYDDSQYLPKSESDKVFIEEMPYNFYWENQEQGKHFRQKGIEAPALRNTRSFLHLNEFKGSTFNPNAGQATNHVYDVPDRVDYLVDNGAGTTQHLIADNRPRADYSKPSAYNAATHQYGDIVGAPSDKKNKSLGGVSVQDHVKKATQADTTGFPKSTVLHPHEDDFEYRPTDRYEDDAYMSPPPSPYHIPEALEMEDISLTGDRRELSDLAHNAKLVEKADYDSIKKETTIKTSSIKQADPAQWKAQQSKFATILPPVKGAATPQPDGQNYLPTTNQNTQLASRHLQLSWIAPDGYCIFNSVGAVTAQPGSAVRLAVLQAIRNDLALQQWITTVYAGGNYMTTEAALETVQKINEYWGKPEADIVLWLIALVLKKGFTVIQDNQPPISVNGGGECLVRVTSPKEHYHATRLSTATASASPVKTVQS